MADVKPFKGWYYNPEKVELEKVIAPPHDVISPEGQEEYYRSSEYNVIRLILGKVLKGDSGKDNRYTRAADFMRKLIADAILMEDDKRSFYAYEMEYALANGKRKSNLGFIALVKLEPFEKKIVLPHEKTLPKQMEDRYNLIKACHADTSPIMSAYSDPELKTKRMLQESVGEPFIKVKDGDGVEHTLWKVDDDARIKRLKDFLKDKRIYIADGHHRYTTALRYYERHPESSDGYIMMLLLNMDDDLTVLPAHRVIREVTEEQMQKLSTYFTMEACDAGKFFQRLENEKADNVYGMYHDKGYSILKPKPEPLKKAFVKDRSEEWNQLDVTVFNRLIIDKAFGIRSDSESERRIAFAKDTRKAFKHVDGGDYEVAFFLRPTKMNEIRKVADKGERMPQKSTYFYPKALSGLIIHRFTQTKQNP
ncbi:MAG: DUF1015 domain-containing protein [Candidatus Altiarchaeota archaeon]